MTAFAVSCQRKIRAILSDLLIAGFRRFVISKERGKGLILWIPLDQIAIERQAVNRKEEFHHLAPKLESVSQRQSERIGMAAVYINANRAVHALPFYRDPLNALANPLPNLPAFLCPHAGKELKHLAGLWELSVFSRCADRGELLSALD